jgi:hypothetical protein
MEIAVNFGVGEEEVEITIRHSEKVPETTSGDSTRPHRPILTF